jgi:hypothetical protein
MTSILKTFFLCFLPKLLGGERTDGAYSTRRLTFVGSISFLVFLSIYVAYLYSANGEFSLILELIDRWVLLVIISGVLVSMSGSAALISGIVKLIYKKNDKNN